MPDVCTGAGIAQWLEIERSRVRISAGAAGVHLTYVALHEVAWCMVVWCTQNAPRWQQFHVAPAMPAL